MPAILDRLVSQLVSDGKSRKNAYAIAVASLQKSGNLKPGTTEATQKGIARGSMTPAQRAIDRANKRKKGSYKYNPINNTAVKGKINYKVKPKA